MFRGTFARKPPEHRSRTQVRPRIIAPNPLLESKKTGLRNPLLTAPRKAYIRGESPLHPAKRLRANMIIHSTVSQITICFSVRISPASGYRKAESQWRLDDDPSPSTYLRGHPSAAVREPGQRTQRPRRPQQDQSHPACAPRLTAPDETSHPHEAGSPRSHGRLGHRASSTFTPNLGLRASGVRGSIKDRSFSAVLHSLRSIQSGASRDILRSRHDLPQRRTVRCITFCGFRPISVRTFPHTIPADAERG